MMDLSDVVPVAVPPGEHPLAGCVLGVVPSGSESKVMAHLCDRLGFRLQLPDLVQHRVGWAVDYALPNGRREVAVGDEVDWQIPGAEYGAVRVVAGSLPPGIRLEKHTGKLVGSFAKPGLYDATFEVGPQVKLDMRGDGVGEWIDIHATRTTPVSEASTDLGALTPQELDALAAEALRLARLKAQEVANAGRNPTI